MTDESDLRGATTITRRFVAAGVIAAALSLLAAAAAVIVPIGGGREAMCHAAREELEGPRSAAPDLDDLLRKMAGRRLIRPSQALAAVKDSGAADRLAAKLKLQGVVKTTDRLVAYVQIDKQGVKTVRAGEKLLDFVVKDIEPGKVTLCLEGVEVVLGH